VEYPVLPPSKGSVVVMPDEVVKAGAPLGLDINKAEFFISAGRRRAEIEWLQGFYEATFGIFNNGSEVLTRTFKLKIE
jgi:hypothetical protein